MKGAEGLAKRKIAIVGCRDADEQDAAMLIHHELWAHHVPGMFVIVTGDATGVDAAAWSEAQDEGIECTVFRADWQEHGKAAGPIRNGKIVAACDEMLALWDGKSPGTLDAIRQCVRAGKKVTIVSLEGE